MLTDSQRFEAKYLVSEVQAAAIREFIAPHVVHDFHAPGLYPITSLYFDSPDMMTYWASETGEKNRFKLRIRNYREDVEKPVFFEIKRRQDRIIKKCRARVQGSAVAGILRDEPLSADLMAGASEKDLCDLVQFREHLWRHAASPRVVVRYEREAFVSNTHDPVRVTFDRRLSCRPCVSYTDDIWGYGDGWRHLWSLPVILEIKFTDTFPNWAQRLIQRFHLRWESVCKYVMCVKALHQDGVRIAG